jgi:hypothetical protein
MSLGLMPVGREDRYEGRWAGYDERCQHGEAGLEWR